MIFSLKLTELALEKKLNGSAYVVKGLQKIFKTFRRVTGVPTISDDCRNLYGQLENVNRSKRPSNISMTNICML